tara:strand:- start:157 stop:441 length:285 start_codon:yes stop_codon:yes gene_type:complete
VEAEVVLEQLDKQLQVIVEVLEVTAQLQTYQVQVLLEQVVAAALEMAVVLLVVQEEEVMELPLETMVVLELLIQDQGVVVLSTQELQVLVDQVL